MIEESYVVSEGERINLLDRSTPVYRMKHGKTTKYLKEHNFLGIVKWYTLIKEETVWDDYFSYYDMQTGELIGKTTANSIH